MTLTKDRITDSIYRCTDLPKDRSAEIFRSLAVSGNSWSTKRKDAWAEIPRQVTP